MKRLSMRIKGEVTGTEVLQLYLRRCKANNLSEETIKTYQVKISRFISWLVDNDISLISDINDKIVEEYKVYLHDEPINDTSVVSYLRETRAFLYYCMDCGYLKRFKIGLPKTDKDVKATYSDAELAVLLKKPDLKKADFVEYRTWVFETYLLATGNRLSTALNVRICDIDFDSGIITLRKTKGRKQQIIPLARSLAPILQEYLSYRQGSQDDYLFCDQFGNKATPNSYKLAVRKYNLKRNVRKTSAHLFRHTFAKKWILAGGDAFRLQKMLGHTDLTVTKNYVNMFGADLAKDFDQFNPLDNFAIKDTKIKISK